MQLQMTHGVLGLIGPQVDQMANDALQSLRSNCSSAPKDIIRPEPYQIILVSEAELRRLDHIQVSDLHIDTRRVYALGIGGGREEGVLFVVIIWAAGQQFRKQLGLPPKSFHISLSARDGDSDMDKDIDSLLPGQFPISPSPDLLDHLTFTLFTCGQYQKALPFCVQLIQATPDSHRGFLRHADATLRLRWYKQSMLAYACAFQRTAEPKIQGYCIKKIVECSRFTEWGCIFTEEEMTEMPKDIQSFLTTPWTADLRAILSNINITPTLCLESRERLYLPNDLQVMGSPLQRLPRFFRWLVPFHLAIMSTPRDEFDIAMLASPYISIFHILTLTEETPLPKAWFSGKDIKHTYLPIPNYHPPTIEQIDLIMRLFENEDNLPLLIHCGGGKGRAGTVAACYLAAYGFSKPRSDTTQPFMSATEAINALRAIRPGSIETLQQEAFVSKWCSTIWKRQCVVPPLLPEPLACPLSVEGQLAPDNDLFVLVGLPGSGKSWFSLALMARNARGWTHICQDDSGSRSFSETEIGRASGRVLLDRCNTALDDRERWLKLASWAVSPVCVYFDYGYALCTSRAQNRANHPTLPPGARVRNAVDQMRNVFVRPTLQEGFKAIVTIRSFAASQELVLLLSPPITLYKYPRTPHIIDLGAATDDDIVSNSSIPLVNGHVVITEKVHHCSLHLSLSPLADDGIMQVDGANMGISLSADRQILVQNRARYINPSTHEQFKKLDLWVDRHRHELYKVLDRDEYFAERFVLFGEWVSVTHSIPYTHLPDRFLAFDLYDRRADAFVDRQSLTRILASTGMIQMVPILLEGRMPNDEELCNMVQKRSLFWNGRIEGIYLKVERNGRVITRGKVVRGDFIPGNEHWTRGNLRTNGMDSDEI